VDDQVLKDHQWAVLTPDRSDLEGAATIRC